MSKKTMERLGKDMLCLNLLVEGKKKIKFPNLSMWIDIRDGKISFNGRVKILDLRRPYHFVCGDLKNISTICGVSVKQLKETISKNILNML